MNIPRNHAPPWCHKHSTSTFERKEIHSWQHDFSRSPSVLNVFHQSSLVVEDSYHPLIHADVTQTEKEELIIAYLTELFSLGTTVLTTQHAILTKTTEYYRFSTNFYVFIRN